MAADGNAQPVAAAEAEAQAQAAAGSSPAQAQAPVAAAAQQASPDISDESAKRIAKATIAELEERGVFEEPEPASPPAPEPAAAPEVPPTTAAPPEPETPPAKRSLASRFMGLDK